MPVPSFQALVDTHYESLFRFGQSLAGNATDAADLTQQTFFIWAKKGHALRDIEKAKSWLFTTLYREFLKHHRRSRRIDYREHDEIERTAPPTEPDWLETLDSGLVVDALSRLDETFKAPLTLFYLEDSSYKEIAAILDIPIGTVMSRLSRGKNQLRALLREAIDSPEAHGLPIPFPERQSHG
jgi:RNA polymerase sigma-70 factor (ECF subfamily)